MKKKDWKRFARVGAEVLSIEEAFCFGGGAEDLQIIGTIKNFISPELVEVQTTDESNIYFKNISLLVHRKQVQSIKQKDELLNEKSIEIYLENINTTF
jgi:hypothetical protein